MVRLGLLTNGLVADAADLKIQSVGVRNASAKIASAPVGSHRHRRHAAAVISQHRIGTYPSRTRKSNQRSAQRGRVIAALGLNIYAATRLVF